MLIAWWEAAGGPTMADRWNTVIEELELLDPFFRGIFLVTVAAIGLLAMLLPAGRRRRALQPLGMFAVVLVLLALYSMAPDVHGTGGQPGRGNPLNGLALLMLFCTLGRAAVQLVTEARPLRSFFTHVPKILIDLTQVAIYIVVVLVVLIRVGVNVTSIVTSSAVLAAVLGFVMKDTLGNLFAGLAIQAQRPFVVGDWIQFDDRQDHIGKVIEINWRATRLWTLDDLEVVVPNATLAMVAIKNYTQPLRHSRRSIYFTAPYSAPTRQVQRVVLEAIRGSWGVLEEPAPSVVTYDFTERGVLYWTRVFTKEMDSRDKVDGGVRDRIWYALKRHGIEIPGPLRQVRLTEQTQETEARDAEARFKGRVAALRRVDWLSDAADDVIQDLAADAARRFYAQGETILRQGEPGTELFIILDGTVRIEVRRPDGSTLSLPPLGPSDFFGEMSLLTGEPRTATVIALEHCEFLVVGKESLARAFDAHPELAQHIDEVISHRRDVQRRLEDEAQRRGTGPLEEGSLWSRIRRSFGIP